MFRVTCIHIMQNGKNKNNVCGKEGTYVEGTEIPYCMTHRQKYESVYLPEIRKKQSEKLKVQIEEKTKFKKDLEPRRLDYNEIFRMGRSQEIPDFPEKSVSDIISAVDKICETAIIAYHMLRPMGALCNLYVFPFQYSSFSVEEIKAEFVKRGFDVFDEKKGIFVRMKYLPDM
jgi:hypothetical protein